MWFEGRDLKTYAEPVSFNELIEHGVYFALTYVDEEMLIPQMDTVVFVGVNLNDHDIDQVYFQDIESFRSGIRYKSTDREGAVFFSGSKNELQHIFRFEQALDQLLVCSVRREKTRSSGREIL